MVPVITDVPDEIRRIIREGLNIDEERITLDASFREELGADSLALLDLTLTMEEAFDIEMSDEEADKIRTVRDAVTSIEKHVQAKRSS